MGGYRTFLVPFDFSIHAQAALYTAMDLARRMGADVHLIHVLQPPSLAYGYGPYPGGTVPPPIDMAEIREGALRSLREVAAGIEDVPGALEVLVTEGPNVAEAIRETAEKLRADLIVMGTHGRTGLAHVFLGSVTERTLRHAPCPVLSVQAPEEEAAEAASD